MPKNVRLPDGRVVAFPDEMSDEAVAGAIKQSMGGGALQQNFSDQHPILGGIADFGTGLAKGAMNTVSNAADGLNWASQKLGGPSLTTPEMQAHAHELATANNAAQSLGKGAEQVGEFFLPGVGEEAAISKVAARAPALATAARYGVKAAVSGAVNKLQGGTFTGGATGGAAGVGLGQLAQKAAPILAETALRMRAPDRAYGATPGRAILDLTKGLSPASVVESARGAMSGLEEKVSNALGSATTPVNLDGVRQIAASALGKATSENEPSTIKALRSLAGQVGTDTTTGSPISQLLAAPQAAALNRGISNARTSWNPATANSSMNAAAGMMHHGLGDAIADVAPEVRPLNQQIQSLIPVLQRGTAADLNAGVLQRTVGRVGAHTGALAGGLAGLHYGGIPGAIAGTVGPELLASPEAQLMAARAANSPTLRKLVLPAINAVAQQGFRGGQQ